MPALNIDKENAVIRFSNSIYDECVVVSALGEFNNRYSNLFDTEFSMSWSDNLSDRYFFVVFKNKEDLKKGKKRKKIDKKVIFDFCNVVLKSQAKQKDKIKTK